MEYWSSTRCKEKRQENTDAKSATSMARSTGSFKSLSAVSIYRHTSGSRGVMVNTLHSPYNDPGSIPGSRGAVGIWVYYTCGSATSFTRDVKQGCRMCTHAFKFMHGR